MSATIKRILVTGATGYVGGRLIPELLAQGYLVRAVSRSKTKLQHRSWASHPNVELYAADVLNQNELTKAAEDCWAAYYLVHAMVSGGKNFAVVDQQAALHMVRAAEAAHLNRIIYLGGLGEDTADLSQHLRSRAEVGRTLQQGRVPVTVLRAAMIIGSGSASFEILRYLVDRLPVMITPRWLTTSCQPIAIRNVIAYLAGCLKTESVKGKTFDIGGADVVTYYELMKQYAKYAKLKKRWILPIPILTPRLSAYWIRLVTPIPASIARPLAEGLRNPVVCRDNEIAKLIPQQLLTSEQAIELAALQHQAHQIDSHWTDAGHLPPVEWSRDGDPSWAGGAIREDSRSEVLNASAKEVWHVIQCIGGANGWYHANWLWALRGWLDQLIGGVGLRRGRRHPEHIHPGDALDFWRVVGVQPEKRLLLAAEMKLPGEATLEFILTERNANETLLTQRAQFLPRGLSGLLYWNCVAPLHHYVFRGMLKKIIQRVHARK